MIGSRPPRGAGLRAVVVYNAIEGIYRNRAYATDKYDYDCSRGSGVVSKFTQKMDGFRGCSP